MAQERFGAERAGRRRTEAFGEPHGVLMDSFRDGEGRAEAPAPRRRTASALATWWSLAMAARSLGKTIVILLMLNE